MLSSKYDDQVEEMCRFDVDMLFLSMKAKKVNVSLESILVTENLYLFYPCAMQVICYFQYKLTTSIVLMASVYKRFYFP